MSLVFLSIENVLAIHSRQIQVTGGLAGVRDHALLESAVGTPQASAGGSYLHRTLPEMAAAYLFHLAKNHPFFDGNKRVAAEAAVMFLEANGHAFDADPDSFADLVLEVARGNASKVQVAEFFDRHVTPRRP